MLRIYSTAPIGRCDCYKPVPPVFAEFVDAKVFLSNIPIGLPCVSFK